MSDFYGGTQTYLYRKPKYLTLGTTPLRRPFTADIESVYGEEQLYSLVRLETPSIPQITPKTSTTQTQPPIFPTIEQTISTQEGWQKWTDLAGNEVWMPTQRADKTPIAEGDIYTSPGGNKYYWSAKLGKWLNLKRDVDPEFGIVKWIIDPENQAFVGREQLGNLSGKLISYESIGPEGNLGSQLENLKKQYNDLIKQANAITTENPYDLGINLAIHNKADIKNILEKLSALKRGLNNELDLIVRIGEEHGNKGRADELRRKIKETEYLYKKLANFYNASSDVLGKLEENIPAIQKQITNAPQTTSNQITSWQEDFKNAIDKLTKGEINVEDLPNGNWVEKWLGNLIQTSYKTGSITTPFTQIDEEGNEKLSPEIESLISSYDENIEKQHTDFMKRLRLAAIQRGHSVNDVFYNEALSNYQTQAAMQISTNIANTLMSDVEQQYKFIADTLTEAVRSAASDVEANAFAEAMLRKWNDARLEFEQQMDAIAQEIAATKAARTGQIITSIVGFIASIIGAVI